MRLLKQSTAANVMVFMTDSADHVSGKASLTLTITASKDGGAFASISPTVTERGSGWYSLALTTAHTDTLGDLALHVTATGADPSDLACRVVAGALDADVSTRLATAGYTAPDNAGITTLTGRLTSGRATNLDNLDATVSSRLATAGYTAPDNAGITTLTGRLTAPRATNLDNLDASVSSRSTYAGGDTAGTTTLLARLTSGRAANLDLLDVAISVVAQYIDTEVTAIKAKTDNLPASPAAVGSAMNLDAAAVDAIMDELVTSTRTMRQILRLLAAAAGGKASGLDTNAPKYRNPEDTKDVITSVTDASGNRTSVTLDLS